MMNLDLEYLARLGYKRTAVNLLIDHPSSHENDGGGIDTV
jgi:hypothetical protein